LRVSCRAQTDQPQAGDGGCCRSHTYDFLHPASVPTNVDVKRSGAQAFSIRYTGESGKFRAARDTHT
jgi:hypothetical protein